MKKILLFALLSLFAFNNSFAQSAKEMMAEIEGKYELDDNGNVTFSRVIEVPGLSKEDIFIRAQNYFTYNYGSGKSVMQVQDKDAGVLVGKGFYDKVHTGFGLVTTHVSAWHILRIDAREGRARAIVTLTTYDKEVIGNGSTKKGSENIADTYPLNPKGGSKIVMSKAFYKTYHLAFASLDGVEKAIKEGSTSSSIENEDW